MIELSNVSKSYKNSDSKAVDNVSVTVEDGKVFGFIGPNGAGKTTTIKLICGILNVDQGGVVINGFDMKKQPIKAKQMIGYVPDEFEMYDRLTGYQYLHFIADMYLVSKNDRNQRIVYYSELFGLVDALSQKIRSYSRGMKKKLSVIGALIHDPQVLLLDEPMTGLDPNAAFKLKEVISEFCSKGKTVFYSTHVLDVAEKICEDIVLINHGKIVAAGDMKQLIEESEVNTLEEYFIKLTNEKITDGDLNE